MAASQPDAREVRESLYDVFRSDREFEQKAEAALEMGREYLGVDNGHLTRIDPKTDHWEAMASTDPTDGTIPEGLELDLELTYCRRTIEAESEIALHDVPNQGWAEDQAFLEHGIHCYHGTTLEVDDELYGTVCFIAEEPRPERFSVGETMFVGLITQLLERELERDRHELELRRQNNLANVFNRVLRHNLRNDMAVIRGYTQLMDNELGDQNHGDTALRHIDHLIELSEKAREIEQVVGGAFDRHSTELVGLLEDVIERVADQYPDASISLESDNDSMVAPLLPSFERAIEELVENAGKHAGEQPTVNVRILAVPNGVEIQIEDDGPGLSDQERQVLDSGSETPLVHGSGLGLWLAHWIVTSHDGSVTADVTESGTTMTVDVPRLPETSLGATLTELVRTRDKYQAAFEESTDAMVILDDQGRILAANPAASRLSAMDRNELLGRSIAQFLPDPIDVKAEWQHIQSQTAERDETVLVDATGKERPIEYAATIDIVPGQHLLVVRDISEQKAYERKLCQQRDRFRAVFEDANDAMVLADDDGRYLVVNESAAELFGLPKGELIGRSFEEISPADVDFEREWRRFRDAEEERGTCQLVRPDEERRTVECAATENIVPGEHLLVIRETTAQAKRERILGELHEILDDDEWSGREKTRELLELGREALDIEYGTLSSIEGEEYVFEVTAADDENIQDGDVAPVEATNCEIVASEERALAIGDISRDAPEETERAGYTDWGIECYIGAPVYVDGTLYGTLCFYACEPLADQFSEWEIILVDLMSRCVSYELQQDSVRQRVA